MFKKILNAFILLGIVMNSGSINATQPTIRVSPFLIERNGRDFDSISIHPNGEEWLFTECSKELKPEGDCYLLRYNLKDKKLQRYLVPDGYLYSYASFSPEGNWIVMNRVPKHDGSETKIRQSFENGEIVIMRIDGSEFKVLPIIKGRNIAPVMSKNEKKIAYWRVSTQRGLESKNTLIDFDIYEYDLETGSSSIFAGPFQFLEGGNLQYVSEDEVLFSSFAPRKYAKSLSVYMNKYNNSQVYKLARNNFNYPEPYFIDINNAKSPSIDQDGNMYLEGENKDGTSFFKIDGFGNISSWPVLINVGIRGLRHIVASPNGYYIAFIYVAEAARYRDRKNAMGLLELGNGAWLPISIPSLKLSIPLHVNATIE